MDGVYVLDGFGSSSPNKQSEIAHGFHVFANPAVPTLTPRHLRPLELYSYSRLFSFSFSPSFSISSSSGLMGPNKQGAVQSMLFMCLVRYGLNGR